MAKLTLEEVKARVFKALPTVEITDDIYINSKTKLSCRCKICGCEFSALYRHLENLHGCPRCAGKERLTLDQAKKRIYAVSPDIEVLSDLYTGVHGKLRCRCLIPDCGCEWEATAKHLFEAHSCPRCGGNERLTLEEVKRRLKEKTDKIEIIQDEYKNINSKFKFRCNEGHVFEGNLKKAMNGGCPICNDYKYMPMSLSSVKAKINEWNPLIEVINDKYDGVDTVIVCKCKLHDSVWESNLGKLSRNAECPKCKSDRMISEIKDKLAEINSDIVVLDDFYQNATTKLKCLCKIDGSIFYSRPDHLLKNHGCPTCGHKKAIDKQRYTLDQVKELLAEINPDIEIVDNEYHNAVTKLKCRCKIHNTFFYQKWGHLKAKVGCPTCGAEKVGESNRLTLEYVKETLSGINPNIEIRENTYINSSEKMECFCKKCSTTFYAAWGNLSQSKGCPQCAIINRSGKNNHNYNGGISTLNEYLRNRITEWKKDSMRKHHYKCVVTGEPFDIVHHLYGFNTIVREMLEIEQLPIYEEINEYTEDELERMSSKLLELHYAHGLGTILKRSVHLEFHSLYGNGDNTPQQFEEFLELKRQEKAS